MGKGGMKEALHWVLRDDGTVHCLLCPHSCRLQRGEAGRCRVRLNAEDVLRSMNYARVSAYGVDPIEKKPLYHFYPGSDILSVGSVGCSFSCQFCQNWVLVHNSDHPTEHITPTQLVERCQEEQKATEGKCIGLAFTYSEPLVWYEYVLEAAELAKTNELKTVLVTNGSVQDKPWQQLLPYLDAVNIDVKSFREEYYRRTCAGALAPVKKAVASAWQAKVHVEVTTLLVEGLNDSEEEIHALAHWLSTLSVDLPLHLSCYYPAYKMTRPPTSLAVLQRSADIARQYLHYVYLGNVWGMEHHSTYCPQCNALLLARRGYSVEARNLQERECSVCGLLLPITGKILAPTS